MNRYSKQSIQAIDCFLVNRLIPLWFTISVENGHVAFKGLPAELLIPSFVLSCHSERKDYGEDRCVGIGLLNARVVVVVYTELDEETVRIISLRKALSHERKPYEQYLKNRLG